MLRNDLRLLVIGYTDSDAELLCSKLADASHYNKFRVECVRDIPDIRSALYETNLDFIISNHDKNSFHSSNVLDLLKANGRDIPLIIYSENRDEEDALSAIRLGAYDYICKGNVARLILAIERELENVAIRKAKLQAESRIYRLAYYDELTGLPKRNLFCEKVTEILSNQIGPDEIAAVYYISFDRLPYINSTYGFSIGDVLIQQLSYRLSVYANKRSFLTRIEGSKFAYFNNNVVSCEAVQEFANRILRLASTPFIINNLEFYVTLSIGVCIYPRDGDKIAKLLANAENTLSDSLGLWKNNCKYYVKEIGDTSAKNLKIERCLREAVGNEQLLLLYLPIVDLQTGEVAGVEALLRWDHPDLGMLLPDQFLPVAFETGLIVDIGKWVLRQICIDTKIWRDKGYDELSVSVNISAIELDQSKLISYVSELLVETKLPPGSLLIEIEESVLMQGAESSMRTLQELKKMGVKIVVDNFGVGSLSLSNLKRLPIDGIKIDRSFVSGLSRDSDNMAIITAIIALAGNFDLLVMASGIETKEQFDFLCDKQCDQAQGYLFGKPVNAESFFLLLEQRRTGTLA